MNFADFKMDPAWNVETKEIYSSFYREIWDENEYDRFGVGVRPGDTVVDCGGSIGLFSKYAKSKGAEKVYAFEANADVYKYFLENTSDDPTIKCVNGLVGDPYSLERIFEEFSLEKIDFLKVDIEGWEYPFIIGASDECLRKVDRIAIELHVWGMFQNSAEEYKKCFSLIEKLSLNGFRVTAEHIHKNTCLYMLYASR